MVFAYTTWNGKSRMHANKVAFAHRIAEPVYSVDIITTIWTELEPKQNFYMEISMPSQTHKHMYMPYQNRVSSQTTHY